MLTDEQIGAALAEADRIQASHHVEHCPRCQWVIRVSVDGLRAAAPASLLAAPVQPPLLTEGELPVAKKAAVKKPAVKKIAAKKPAVAKKPAAKKSAEKKPAAKKPAAKKPAEAAKKPVAKKPAAKKPVAKKLVAKKPAAKPKK
jgi:hypothetical protein